MTRLMKIALCAAGAALAVSAPAFAQSSATQSTTGTTKIIQPITLTKDTDLAFGSVVKPTTSSNIVAISASDGSRGLTGGGDAALAPSTSGRATYTVNGEGGQTFSISAPASFDMTRQGGSETITVTLTPSAASGTISGSLGSAGSSTFGVGGSFSVSSTTASGSYSGAFDATVAYN